MATATDLTVASTIWTTLNRSTKMACGARQPVGDNNSLTFTVLTGSGNKIKITLDPSDTYTVQRYRIRGGEVKLVEETSDVYSDMLNDIVYHMVNK